MRLRKFAFWSSIAVLAAVILAFAWLWTADLGVLKPQIERWVTEATGREFSIGGELSIDIAGESVLVAEDVRLQNAAWADEPDMLRIGRIEVRIDLWSLFSGPVIVELIDLDDAEVYLTLVEGQEPNWQFPVRQEVQPAQADRSDTVPGIRLPHVDVDKVRIRYDSFERDAPLELKIESLTQALRDDEWLVFNLDATLNGKPVSVDGEAGTWDSVLSGTDVRFDISSRLDTVQLTVKGLLDDVRNLRRPSIEFAASAPDIDDLTRLLGIGDEGEGDIALRGMLQPADGGPLQFSVSGNIGRTDVEGNGEFSDLQALDDVTLKLKMSAPDLGPFLRITGIHNVREAPITVDIDVERHGETLQVRHANVEFAGAQLSLTASLPALPQLKDAVVDLDFDGESIERLLNTLGLPQVARGAFDIDLDVGAGDDRVIALKLVAETPLGRATADGSIGSGARLAGSVFNIGIDVPDIALVAKAHDLDTKMPNERLTIAGEIRLAEDGIHIEQPMTVRLGDDDVELGGLIASTPGIRGSRLDVRARGPDLAGLIGKFGPAVLVAALPYDIGGALHVEAAGIRLEEIRGSVGTAELSVDGILNPVPGMVGSKFSVDVSGPEAEQYTEQFEAIRLRPGPFALSGRVEFEQQSVVLRGVELERPGGKLNVDLEIGLPASRQWLDFDIAMRGGDIRDLWHGSGPVEMLEQSFSVRVRGERRGELIDFDRLDIVVGDASAHARGELHLGGVGEGASFQVTVDVPSMARLATVDGRPLRDQALNLQTKVSSSGGAIEARDVDAKFGPSDISGRFRIVRDDRLHADVAVSSESIVIEPLLEEPETPPEPIAKSGDGRMIPDVAMPFDLLGRFDATLQVDVGEFHYKDVAMRNVAVEATVQDGVLDVPTARFDAVSGSVASQFRLDPAGGSGSGFLRVVARDFSLGLASSDPDSPTTADWDISLDVTGTDLRAMLGAANGIIFLRRHGGRVSRGNRFLQALYGGLLEEILDTINPFRKSDPYTQFECIVIATEITDGKLQSAPSSLVSTDKLLIVLKSDINLATEKLELGIRTEPKRRLSVSVAELINPYIQVVGTLAAPRLAVDQQGVLITGGAAVATGGITILAQGLWNRVTRSKDPCGQAVADGLAELGDRLPELDVRENPAP